MKRILPLLLITLVFTGCSKNGTWFFSFDSKEESSSAISSGSSENESHSEKSSESEPQPDNWRMVSEEAFNNAIEKAHSMSDPKFATCLLNGFLTTEYNFNDVMFSRGIDGKYVTASSQAGLDAAKSLVDVKIWDIDYNHLGDGGKYCKPLLYVSDYGKMRIFIKESESIREYSFEEHGYIINFTICKESDDGPVGLLLFTWQK